MACGFPRLASRGGAQKLLNLSSLFYGLLVLAIKFISLLRLILIFLIFRPALARRSYAVARGRHASALARRSARSDHMGTSTGIVSKIVSPGFCAHFP